MAATNSWENVTQYKSCRCGEGDTNIWTTKTSDNPDKPIQKCPNCQVLKSGPLLLSSKGIGWTSWKKRWFILTRTSLVFYKSDPYATPLKGSEANLTLGGIDLNNSGSVVVKADKKLLTVLFPDGRDGRTFTLKAETSEDLHEWRTALENALAQAPSPALATGQNGILRNDVADSVEASAEQRREQPVKSLVVGRPILLALEDIDGSPSFLEKALQFIEQHGIKVEGILRQSADVEEVKHRVREYEQGKIEFSPDEDAHVVGDCIKYIIRELPSSPVPATSCTALVEAYRTDRGSRINAMRAAIAETFPEPNRRLVQRILKMMLTVASNKSVNRMTLSAVAACMAPLLLRPLLAGDCDLEDDFNMGGDGSLQLLQAAAAANHAQAIVIILLEEYERIFDEDHLEEASLSSGLYSESEDGDVEDEESIDNDSMDDDGYNDPDNNSLEADREDGSECSYSETLSECHSDVGDDSCDHKASDDQNSDSSSPLDNEIVEVTKTLRNTTQSPVIQQTSTDILIPQHGGIHKEDISQSKKSISFIVHSHESNDSTSVVHTSESALESVNHPSAPSITKCTQKSNEPLLSIKRSIALGRTPAKKNLSMESIDFSNEDEIAIQRLEMAKSDLQTKIANEVKGNEILQASLEKRKEVLHECRLTLEQDIERLQDQLQKETELRACLEAGMINLGPGQLPITSSMNSKTRADLEEISLAEVDINTLKQNATVLHGQLSHQRQNCYSFLCESCSHKLYVRYQPPEMEKQNDVGSTTLVHQNESSTKDEDLSSGLAIENVEAREQDSPSSSNRESSWKQLTSEGQNSALSSELNDSQKVEIVTPPQIFSSNNENAPLRTINDHVNTQKADSPSSPKSQLTPKQHVDATKHGAAPKSYSGNENPKLGTESENVKIQTLDLPSSPNKQPPQKLQPNRTNQRSTKYVGPISVPPVHPTNFGNDIFSKKYSPRGEIVRKENAIQKINIQTGSTSASTAWDAASSASRNEKSMHGQDLPSSEEPAIFGRSIASKRSSFRSETLKNESQDPPSIISKQLTQKQQTNVTHQNSLRSPGPGSLSSSEETTPFRNAGFRRSSTRGEETAASASSALAKLTSRLNFLKERRVQLVNELQNLDAGRASGPDRPPPKPDSR